jgi:hypothetical protein
VAAVLGSCPHSIKSMKCGFRHWVDYICITYPEDECSRKVLPPLLSDVAGWSCTFRCFGTFSNYLGYLRSVCEATGYESPPIGHPVIRRAMLAIAKRGMCKEREKMYIQKHARFCLQGRLGLACVPTLLSGTWSERWSKQLTKARKTCASVCCG